MEDTASMDKGLLEICRRERPGELVKIENTETLVDGLFLDAKRYERSEVGRYKVNKKLKLDVPLDTQTLTIEDIEALLGCLIDTSEEVAEDEEFGRVNYERDRKSTRLNSSHANISYAVFCLKNNRTSSAC